MQIIGIDITELLILVPALIAAGLLAGVAAGLLGIGGGAILVPVLFQLFTFLKVDPSITMHLSVGTSLAIIIPTSIRSLKGHMAKGAVDVILLKSWIFPVLFGCVLGTIIASYVDGFLLKAVFAFFSTLIGLKLIFGKETWLISKQMPSKINNKVISGVIGMFSTLMGIGGGIFGVTYMTLFGRKIHQSIATSSGLGLLISIPATMGFMWAGWGTAGLPALSLGYVNWLGVGIMVPATVLAAPIGVKLAHSFSRRTLEMAFAALLFFVSARFVISLL
ncbi:MAG: sulfite exporter TauE/SafE family protein [Rhizobiales bacterium]|nr:sulfite exporter TauE/SafE family protein [Hyphomicrobiales bacterium]NRB13057.1 sulfite exporter TauE/SafE family protein [Hyphomicrobiales bacterium]